MVGIAGKPVIFSGVKEDVSLLDGCPQHCRRFVEIHRRTGGMGHSHTADTEGRDFQSTQKSGLYHTDIVSR